MRSGAEGSRGPGDLGFEPTEAELRTQVQILSLRLLGRGAESLEKSRVSVFFCLKNSNGNRLVKNLVTNLVTKFFSFFHFVDFCQIVLLEKSIFIRYSIFIL